MMQVNGMLLEGKKVFVGPFLKRTDRPADKEAHYTNIYVKNLAESVTEEQLDKMFGEFGKVCCHTLACFAPQTLCETLPRFPCRSPLLVVLASVSGATSRQVSRHPMMELQTCEGVRVRHMHVACCRRHRCRPY